LGCVESVEGFLKKRVDLNMLLIINNLMRMSKTKEHAKIAIENLAGVMDEYNAARYSNVGLLAVRALEQMVEACAAKENLHFHEHPRVAHRDRREWLRSHHPDLVKEWDALWLMYGTLGYGGVNGGKAREALRISERVVKELARREEIEL